MKKIILKKLRISTPEEVKARRCQFSKWHNQYSIQQKRKFESMMHHISDEEYKKIAEEAMHCPICCGRPILHMRMCMKKIKKVI